MYFTLVPLLSIPFALWLGLRWMEGSGELDRAREQTKWDAVSLSLCHQARSYLEGANANWNRQIEVHQTAMSLQAASCWTAALAAALTGGPLAYAAEMKICNSLLAAPALVGAGMEKSQLSFLQGKLLQIYTLETSSLISKNNLETQHFQRIGLHSASAFSRKELRSYDRFFEDLIALHGPKRKWPRILAATDAFRFREKFKVKVGFRPEVKIFDSPPSMKLTSFQSASLESLCWISETKPGYRYEVKRR